MFEPLRFLHAAEAALDVPLGDLPSLPDELRNLAEDATLLTFDRLVEKAISLKVDFLLLTGSTFREADQSLRARLHLLSGLGQLDEHGISVFVLPGPDDPESAWQDLPDLPANVTVLAKDDELDVPVAVIREDRVIATITATSLSRTTPPSEAEGAYDREDVGPQSAGRDSIRSAPFRIGLLTEWPPECFPANADEHELGRQLSTLECDYLAVPDCDLKANARGWRFQSGQTVNTKDGIAHHPGRLQGLSERETGPHGATLIEVDKQGRIRGTFQPFAAVRRLRLEVPIPPEASVEDIAQEMISLLDAEKPAVNEQGWFITWILTGSGAALELLKARPAQAELLDLLPSESDRDQAISLHHQLRFQETSAPIGEAESSSDLARLYRESLGAALANDLGLFSNLADRVLSGLGDLGPEDWQDRLAPWVRDLDTGDILARAYALGREWFATEQES